MILASKCSVFSQQKLYLPSLILMAVEGLGEKENCTKRGVQQSKLRRGMGIGE